MSLLRKMILVSFLPYFIIIYITAGSNTWTYAVDADEFDLDGSQQFVPTRLRGSVADASSTISTKASPQGRTVYIRSALDPMYSAYLNQAIQQLENAIDFEVKHFIIFPITSTSRNSCDEGPYGEILFICNDNYGATLWSSLEVTISNGGAPERNIVKINDYYMKQAAPDYIQYTFCHEIRKCLDHMNINIYNDFMLSCMDLNGYGNDLQPYKKDDYDASIDVHRYRNLLSQEIMPSMKTKYFFSARLPSSKLSTRRALSSDCCSFNDKICGGMAEFCDASKSTCEEDCGGFWLDSTAQKSRIESNCTGLFERCTMDSDCCSSLCQTGFYKVYSTCVPGLPTTSPSKRPTSTPTKSPTGKPTKRPVTKAPTAIPTSSATLHPTYLSCCSHNNKICGGMASFCSSSQKTCETDCAGYWLNDEALQARARSNCIGLFDVCSTDEECCGNSSCEQNVYLGYSVCVPGPPTSSPTKQPTSPPTKALTASPTKMPITITMAPTTTPCCSYDNEHCGGMQPLCDSNKSICEKTCAGFWIHGKTQKDGEVNPAGEPTSPPTIQTNDSIQHDTYKMIDCYCPQTCTNDILNSIYGFYTCKDYLEYQMKENGVPELYACVLVSESTAGACGGDSCNPYRCPGSQLRRLQQLKPSST